jgi:hypothetical protein
MFVTFMPKLSMTRQKGMAHMMPQSQSVLALIIPPCRKLLFQQCVCQNACLGETAHLFPDLNVDPSVRVDYVMQVVCEYNFFWDHVQA